MVIRYIHNGNYTLYKCIFDAYYYNDIKIIEIEFELSKFLVTNIKQGDMYGWLLLSMCEHQMSLYEEALISLITANELYESTNSANLGVKNRIITLLPELLSRSKQPSNWEKVIEICSKVRHCI